MSTEPAPQDQPKPVCCGKGGPSWSPKKDEPQVLACQLCPDPDNPNYWRRTSSTAA